MISRSLIFLFGLVVLSLGIATVTHAGLGTGTVSSAAIVLARETGLTMGLFVFLTNAFFFVLQCLVDPKNIWIKALKQLPTCAVFGAVFDLSMWVTDFMQPTSYAWAFLQVCLGTVLTGLGVSGMVFARLLVLPPEGLAIAVMHRFGGSFGTIRMMIDVFFGDRVGGHEPELFRHDLRPARGDSRDRRLCRTLRPRLSEKVGAALSAAPSDRLKKQKIGRGRAKFQNF